MMRLLFIAVIYNSVKETRDLCLSLTEQDPGKYEISLVLVDNSDKLDVQSKIDELANEFSFALVLRPGKNIGYFPAISFALSTCGRGFDFVIAGNNDLVYSKSFCFTLCKQIYANETMVVCPDVVTSDGVHQNPHHKYSLSRLEKLYFDLYFTHYLWASVLSRIKKFAMILGFFKRHSTLSIRGGQVGQEIDKGIGAVYIFRSRFLECIDYKLYSPTFLYGEEACLSWQVRSAGGKTWYDPSLQVLHIGNVTLGRLENRRSYGLARESHWKIRAKL